MVQPSVFSAPRKPMRKTLKNHLYTIYLRKKNKVGQRTQKQDATQSHNTACFFFKTLQWGSCALLLHRGALHRGALHGGSFTQRSLYTGRTLHTGSFTHRVFYTEKLLHRKGSTHKSFYTEKSLYRVAAVALTQRSLHTQGFLHRETFYTEQLLHRVVFTRKSLYTQRLWHREVFSQRSFCTEKFLAKK